MESEYLNHPPDLFEALDYRVWLKEMLSYLKGRTKLYSLRYVSAKTGVDPSTLLKVLSGSLHLNEKYLIPMAHLLKMDERSQHYWQCLYRFNRAKTAAESTKWFAELVRAKSPGTHVLPCEKYRYFQHWYHVAIRESLRIFPFKDDYRSLAQSLNPPIKTEEARTAIATLIELGLIRRNDTGFLEVEESFISTGNSWNSAAIRQFQQQVLELGCSALYRIPKEKRDISTLTVCVSKAGFEAIRKRLAQTRAEILEITHLDKSPEMVLQINLQVFPLTRTNGKSP